MFTIPSGFLNLLIFVIFTANFGTCVGVASIRNSGHGRKMWDEKNRDGELPRFPPSQDLRLPSTSIGEAHEVLRRGLQQFLSSKDADLGTYLSNLIFQRIEPFIDEYGHEIDSYPKVFGFIWQQYNESLLENYAINQFDKDKLYLCGVARFLSHQTQVNDRRTIMKRMGDALGYKCHPCSPYNPKRYGETNVPNTDNVGQDGLSPEESLILCKRVEEDGQESLLTTSPAPIVSTIDDKIGLAMEVIEELTPTNEESVSPIALLVEPDSGNGVKICNTSTNTKPHHSGQWSKNECAVPHLGSTNNPCVMLPVFGCYCIVKEKKTREEADSFCRNYEMQLVWLTSQKENEEVFNLMVKNNMSGFWTSGVDKELNEKWKWEQPISSNSFPIKNFNWCKGEPDNYDGNEHFVLVKNHPDKMKCWEDAPGHVRWPAICKPSLSPYMLLDDLTNVQSQLTEILGELAEQKKYFQSHVGQTDPVASSHNTNSNTKIFHFHFAN